jgi:hypothetical protein
MKKVIPVLLALVLIAVIAWFTFGQQVVEKYTYSDERADLNEYFNIMKADEVAILLQDDRLEEKALMDRIYELSKNGVAFTLKEDELKKEREPIPFIFDAPPVPPMPPRPPIVQGLLRPEPFEPLDSPIVPTLPISQPKEKKRGIFDKIKKEK